MREEQNRTIHCSFDVTPDEADIIKQKMAAAGLKNKSAFFRAMVLNGYLLRLDFPELRKLVRLISRLSNNVNQIALRMNEKGNIYETELDEIIRNEQEISEMLWQMIERLYRISEIP
ncbi:MAG: plasmid mobilization relaxosome protein MobC [Clostridia bacterium]|nr:plasmid mobilization relaxosome protein MobC [Clostridia bacterium]